jgi:hypothetical protein
LHSSASTRKATILALKSDEPDEYVTKLLVSGCLTSKKKQVFMGLLRKYKLYMKMMTT